MGSRLSNWPHRDETYTSVVTIIELLNGIGKNPEEYRKRRSAIVGLFRAGTEIDWQLPEIRLRCAFEVLRSKYDIFEKRTECLRSILSCLGRSRSVDEFLLSETSLRLMYPLPYFAEFDERMSGDHIDAFKRWTPLNRGELFQHESTLQLLAIFDLPADATVKQLSERVAGSEFDFGLTIFAMSEKFSAEEDLATEEMQASIFNSYDGSIDIYIRALALQQWREVGLAHAPSRNTGVDLYHLLYLVSGTELVTADVAMARAAVAAGGRVANLKSLGVNV
jgi:hypothetical protein